MPVLISARTPRATRALQQQLSQLASGMLLWLGHTECELSVLLCDDPAIRKLNAQYRNQPKATDVLAFGTELPGTRHASPQLTSGVLGDVVISLQTAKRQAKEHSASLLQETAFLLAHGLLHLLGMDHDTPRKAAAMNRRTVELLCAVGLSPPIGVRALPVSQLAAKRLKHRPKVRLRAQRTR